MAKNNTFKINGKTVVAKPFDYNLMCDLEDLGASISDMQTKQNSFVRAYVALCLDITIDEAGKEIASHVIGGGNFEGILEAMNKEMTDSDFFQALAKTTEEKNQ